MYLTFRAPSPTVCQHLQGSLLHNQVVHHRHTLPLLLYRTVNFLWSFGDYIESCAEERRVNHLLTHSTMHPSFRSKYYINSLSFLIYLSHATPHPNVPAKLHHTTSNLLPSCSSSSPLSTKFTLVHIPPSSLQVPRHNIHTHFSRLVFILLLHLIRLLEPPHHLKRFSL